MKTRNWWRLSVSVGLVSWIGCTQQLTVLPSAEDADESSPPRGANSESETNNPAAQFAGPSAKQPLPLEQEIGLSPEELAYLSLLFSRADLEFDLSRIPADTDGDAIPNVVDDDIDNDGIPNEDDSDVDGDGDLNRDDDDIDDDGIDNDDDDDIDGDGVANDDDPDADGDGLSDRWDLDDDSDGTDDDEDDDDRDDEPSDRLEDLVAAVAGRGWLADSERQQIAVELARRFRDFNEINEFVNLLNRAEALNEAPNRPAPAGGFARDINSVDEIYKQLEGAIEEAKAGQFNPDGPIANRARLRKALTAFKTRARAIVTTAELFGAVRFDEIGDNIEELGDSLEQERLAPFVNGMRAQVPRNKFGMRSTELREFGLLTKGGTRIGAAFRDSDADSILAGIGVLRTLATTEGENDPNDDEFDRLLDRLDEIKEEDDDIDLADAVLRIVDEEEDD